MYEFFQYGIFAEHLQGSTSAFLVVDCKVLSDIYCSAAHTHAHKTHTHTTHTHTRKHNRFDALFFGLGCSIL